MKIIIPSMGRPQLAGRAQRYFPGSIVCIPENEYSDYKEFCTDIEVHPNDVIGLSMKRQWILDRWDGVMVQVDDDISNLICISEVPKHYYQEPGNTWLRLLENTAQMCIDVVANVFGYHRSPDPRKYNPYKPFSLNSYVQQVIGIINRDVRFDENLMLRVDADFTLQNLMKYRIVWQDQRYGFTGDRSGLVGGNSGNRSRARDEWEKEYLKRKWGKYITFSEKKTTVSLGTRVNRSFTNGVTV